MLCVQSEQFVYDAQRKALITQFSRRCFLELNAAVRCCYAPRWTLPMSSYTALDAAMLWKQLTGTALRQLVWFCVKKRRQHNDGFLTLRDLCVKGLQPLSFFFLCHALSLFLSLCLSCSPPSPCVSHLFSPSPYVSPLLLTVSIPATLSFHLELITSFPG